MPTDKQINDICFLTWTKEFDPLNEPVGPTHLGKLTIDQADVVVKLMVAKKWDQAFKMISDSRVTRTVYEAQHD